MNHEIRSADFPQGGRWNDFAITPPSHMLAIGEEERGTQLVSAEGLCVGALFVPRSSCVPFFSLGSGSGASGALGAAAKAIGAASMGQVNPRVVPPSGNPTWWNPLSWTKNEWSALGAGLDDGAYMTANGITWGIFADQARDAKMSHIYGNTTVGISTGAGKVASLAIVAATGCAAAGFNPWLGKIAIHGAHHTFPLIGKARHLQIMIRTGRHITRHLRIPIWWD